MNALFPLVSDWFSDRYGEPTEPQIAGWPIIRAGRDVLISAPTGSGKILAAFTTALDSLVHRAAEGPLPDQTLVVYVSPLKALTNDIRKNLETPLGELLALAAERGLPLPPIRTATRTGDTPAADRARMLRKPRRAMTLAVEVPGDELGAVATSEMWGEIYDRFAALVREHTTTLVFVGTRRMSERVAFALGTRLGEGVVLPHHGSLSRDIRFATENRLKTGDVKAVVATASLELGIDISSVDLVVQLGSPRSIGVALQRVGRSGHWIGAKPEGQLFATTRDELIECGALVHAMRNGAMDALRIPVAPLDVLAQQLVANCAGDDWDVDELFALVRSTQPSASCRAKISTTCWPCSSTASRDVARSSCRAA